MNFRKLTLIFYAGMIVIIIAAAALHTTAYAQTCGLPGQQPCPPPSGGGGNNPTPIPRLLRTSTPTSTLAATPVPTQTSDPIYLTAMACWNEKFRKTPQPDLPTPSWGDIQGDAPECLPTLTPSPVPTIFISHVAGPNFLPPGVINIIIAVLIIVVCLGGGFLLWRSRRGGGSPNADDLNPQPFPPKGMGDGSNQFQKADSQFLKFEDGSNQFLKFEDGSNQFLKFEDGSNQFQKADGTNQFGKVKPGQNGPNLNQGNGPKL